MGLLALAGSASGEARYTAVQCYPGLGSQDHSSAEFSGAPRYRHAAACSEKGLVLHSPRRKVRPRHGAWTILAPKGTRFTSVSLQSRQRSAKGWHPGVELVGTGGELSSLSVPADSSWHKGGMKGSFKALVSRLACKAPARSPRPRIRTCFRSRRSYLHTRQFEFDIADGADPEISNPAGSLLGGGIRAGLQSLTFTASDRGGGLSQVFLRVNGIKTASRDFRCDLVRFAGTSVGDRLSPCPSIRTETLTANASVAPFRPGSNAVQACASDYSDSRRGFLANTSCSPPRTVIANGGCDKLATTSGADSSSGNVLSPYRSAQRLANTLANGQTGCFRAGTFTGQVTVTRPGITLTSVPGERATLRGRIWIDADRVTVRSLNLDGRNTGNSPAVTANDVKFANVDVTNHHTPGVCFVLGSASGYGRAVRTVIENSRVHNCGPLPSGNQGHGIYVSRADGAVIRNNWIYDNVDRGIQLYPDARFAHVYGNMIDGNGEGIIISGDGGTASSGNLVEGNVISNSNLRWNVESNWPGNKVGTGNVVRNNCVWATNSDSTFRQRGGIISAWGFSSTGNVIGDPLFVSRFWKDFHMKPASRCGFIY